MSAMASQTTSLTIVYSTVYSATDQRKYQSSASLALVRGIIWWLVNSSHEGPVTWKMFPFDVVIICAIIDTHFPVFLCSMAALHQAALVGNTNIMQALLENGIMVDIKDNKGEKNKEIHMLISLNALASAKSSCHLKKESNTISMLSVRAFYIDMHWDDLEVIIGDKAT